MKDTIIISIIIEHFVYEDDRVSLSVVYKDRPDMSGICLVVRENISMLSKLYTCAENMKLAMESIGNKVDIKTRVWANPNNEDSE